MLTFFLDAPLQNSVPVWALSASSLEAWREAHAGPLAQWVDLSAFRAEAGRVLLLPGGEHGIAGALLGLGDGRDPFLFAALPGALPEGCYHLEGDLGADPSLAVFGYALGTYAFTRYRGKAHTWPSLVLPAGVDGEEVSRLVRATFLARDLINTPPNDMGPAEVAEAAIVVANAHGASVRLVVGDELLSENYPLIHAVGRASTRAPRLVAFTWGREDAPKVTLVGKGVAFDSGGLDLKPSAGMLLMKKDMGGAANVLALASLIMEEKLDVRLHVLIPTVENSVSGSAMRPSDIIVSRKGVSVEIGNTDAEGRLILADALVDADADAPDLLIDLATLTGSARTALGPDVPPFYTDNETLAAELAASSAAVADPIWRMPLWMPYDNWLDSKVADMNSVSDGPFAGSITAALFLRRFVEKAGAYVHFDIYGWVAKPRPGRPVGGEAQAIRALFHLIKRRYG